MALVYLNGEYLPEEEAKISPLDRGFLFGDGVYEVIPVYDSHIFSLGEHLSRLEQSLDLIHIPSPLTRDDYIAIIQKLLSARMQHSHQKIYIQISRGASTSRNHTYEKLTPTVYIRIDNYTPRPYDELQKGVKVITEKDNRWAQCNIKSTSLLANVLHIITAKQNNCEEVLLFSHGVLTEGASSNIFIVKDTTLMTPKETSNILHGITRRVVIKCAQSLGISVVERDVSHEELMCADEVWITSSTREIMPVHTIDNHTLPHTRALWEKMYTQYTMHIKSEGHRE